MLSESGTKPVILSFIPGYLDHNVPNISSSQYPKPLSSLYDPSFLKLYYPGLFKKSEAVANCCAWNGSVSWKWIKAAMPLKYLVSIQIWTNYCIKNESCVPHKFSKPFTKLDQICYPKSFVFQSKQTKLGSSHEDLACSSWWIATNFILIRVVCVRWWTTTNFINYAIWTFWLTSFLAASDTLAFLLSYLPLTVETVAPNFLWPKWREGDQSGFVSSNKSAGFPDKKCLEQFRLFFYLLCKCNPRYSH